MIEFYGKYKIYVQEPVEGAKYTFTSSSKKIVTVSKATIRPTYWAEDLSLGEGFNAYTKSKDSIFYIANDEYNQPAIFGNKEGTAKLNIYEGKDEKSKKLVGSSEIEISSDYDAIEKTSYITYVGDDSSYLFTRTPSNADVNSITLTALDDNIITAKYGKRTTSCTVKVYETFEDYVDAEYLNH